MGKTRRGAVERVGRATYLVAIGLLVMSIGSDAYASPADKTVAEVILDEIGPGWTRTRPDPEPSTAEGAVRLFTSDDLTLQLHAEPSVDCSSGVTGRSNNLALVRSLAFEELPTDDSGVERFTADTGGAPIAAAVFSTARFAFLVFVFANDHRIELSPVLDSVVALQAARDGGVVIDSGTAASRLDDIIIDSPPVPGLGNQLDYTRDASCDHSLAQSSEVIAFASKHSTERLRSWLDLSTKSSAVINLIDYPYELYAGIAAGPLSSGLEPLPTDAIDGLDRIPNVTAWRVDGDRPQYFAKFRRGRILALIAVAEGSDPAGARATLSALARAQFTAMPSGATSAIRAPTPAKSVMTSGSLIALIGVGVLGVRRARAGRVARTPVRRDDARSVDVSDRASEMRRRGAVLGAVQVACIVAILVFLASDLGWIRIVGAASTVLLGIVTTVLWRRQEGRVLGVVSSDRVHPRPSPASVLLTTAALTLLACGGGLVVWGLRETLFAPSITHLRLSDRLSIEPRLLAWLIALIGLIVIVIDSFVLRAARAVARIGWREWTEAVAPIVYLRSFEDDDVQLANVLSARRPFLEFFTLRGSDAFEESVAWELACYGPVLAIARPGRSHVSLGAARMHLGDDEWKAVISEQIAEAKAVVITIGRTPGLAWEIAHIVHAGHLNKTVLVVPPVDPEEILLRWNFIADTLASAGAGEHVISADPACLVAVKVRVAERPTTVYCADRRDEATYRAAVIAVLA